MRRMYVQLVMLFMCSFIVTCEVHAGDTFRYVITGSGLRFFDTPISEEFAQPADLRTFTKCTSVSIVLSDPAGGSGEAFQECVDPMQPYAVYSVHSYSVDDRQWSQCRLLSRSARQLKLLCPILYVKESQN